MRRNAYALLERRGLVEVELLARPAGHRRIAVRQHQRLDLLERSVGRRIVEGDEGDREARSLMEIVQRDLFRGEIEVPQFVTDAPNDPAFVFERLRVGDVQLEKCDAN